MYSPNTVGVLAFYLAHNGCRELDVEALAGGKCSI
jgi:hypothetical protein